MSEFQRDPPRSKVNDGPTAEEASRPHHEANLEGPGRAGAKRQRVRLSCLVCRRRKLSCDRGYPCERCLKSAIPLQCTYESRPGLPPPAKNGLSQGALSNLDVSRSSFQGSGAGESGTSAGYRDVSRDGDRIRRLELELAHLRSIVSNKLTSDGSLTLNEDTPSKDGADSALLPLSPEVLPMIFDRNIGCPPDEGELRFCRGREFTKRHCGPQATYRAFRELSGLTPFMKETAEEWFKPLHIAGNKDRGKRKRDRDAHFASRDHALEALLPPTAECDALVDVYLSQFEQLHRIIHVPSFRREYAKFWSDGPDTHRYAAFTALLLVICSISTCLHGNPTGNYVGTVSHSHAQAEKWIKAAEEWHGRQSSKHRKLIHYQIACTLYLAKKVNTIKKKLFWKNAGSLLQDCVGVGMHKEPALLHDKISPFNQEIRRRLWATVQEFDLQASCDSGLPTLLAVPLHVETEPPRNIDDDEFDEDWDGKEDGATPLPPGRPDGVYTSASYQHLSRRSLSLRIHLSRVLAGPVEELDYDQVVRYTNDIMQEIDALPSLDADEEPRGLPDMPNTPESKTKHTPLLAYSLLHLQLRQYILPLHQPYLKLRKTQSKYQYSEILFYNAARDMVLLHDRLTKQGIRTLNFLREDVMMLSINLSMVTMLQPQGSSNMVMANSGHTVKLLELCLAMKEDRILRCGNNEPWGYSIMCGCLGLLEAHLGIKTIEAAKAASAERFINLHYRLLAWQDPPAGAGWGAAGAPAGGGGQQAGKGHVAEGMDRAKSVTPFPSASQASNQTLGLGDPPTPWWMPSSDPNLQQPIQPINPDFTLELLGTNINELWGGSWDELT